jgi:two-component system phosphate regulon response regulator PhoB
MSKLILIVDDEPDLVRTLDYRLRKEGFATAVAQNGRDALKRAAKAPRPDLVLLDLMLPDIQGTEVCRTLRAQPGTQDLPVIMLTAKGEEMDRVVGFELGADDYVVKPFSVRELLLRIQAVLRRRQAAASGTAEELAAGDLRVDVPGHRVFVSDNEVQLTAMEFRLLTTLMLRRGRVQTREMLLSDVWEMNPEIDTRTVDTHIKRLREKLGEAASLIETVRGVGYRFRAAEEPA